MPCCGSAPSRATGSTPGSIGDACLGLRLLKDPALAATWNLSEEDRSFLIGRFRRPEPRGNLALLVRNFAQGAIDVSDGLVVDVQKLAQVSHVGALIETARVPFSSAAQKALKRNPEFLATLITAGDDYEIVAAVPEATAVGFEAEAAAKGATLTMIGRIEDHAGEVRGCLAQRARRSSWSTRDSRISSAGSVP